MGRFDNTKFNDRIDTAAAARKALVEKMKNRPGDDDPEVLRKRAERDAIIEARAKREAEKEEAPPAPGREGGSGESRPRGRRSGGTRRAGAG